jgi:hypothetical protein
MVEVTGEWRKLQNEELADPCSSRNIIRVFKSRMRWAGHVARMRARKGVYRVLVGKHEGKRPLGRAGRRWKDNINMDLQEVGWGGMDWINLAQDKGQVAGTCKCGKEPSVSIKCGEFSGSLRTG